MNSLEKIATDLEALATKIEVKENEEHQVKVKEARVVDAENSKKKEELLAPIRSKLAELGESEDEINEKLAGSSVETLELFSKTLSSQDKDEIVEIKEASESNGWGKIESVGTQSKGQKQAGYKDPIEAFAMGN